MSDDAAPTTPTLRRYWVSWISGNYADEGCTMPDFQFYYSGLIPRIDGSGKNDRTICALFEAPNENAIWWLVRLHFPDMQRRFCNPVDPDWLPGDRFLDVTPYKIAA